MNSLEEQLDWPLVLLGLFFLVGYAAHALGRRAHVPRVTLLLLLGVLAGPYVLDLVPHVVSTWFPHVAQVALSMIGFLLGERFVGRNLKESGRAVLWIAAVQTVGTAAVVFFALWAVGIDTRLALLLAGVAPASAPAATVDVIRESRAAGELTDTVLAVVAVDDALGVLLFALLAVAAGILHDGTVSWSALTLGGWEIVGALLLGGTLGLPMAWLTGRIRPGELTLIETLGFVLVCGGFASAIGVSYLLACIALGAVVANRAQHHARPFHAIEGITHPFLIVFFILAGLEFDPVAIGSLGLASVAYVVGRAGGKVLAGRAGARIAEASPAVQRYVGWCLLPQAGVALGLGLLVARRFPELGPDILSLLVGTTFIFEIFGPIATRTGLRLAGETGRANPSGEQSAELG